MKSQSSNRSFGLLFFIVFLIIGLWTLKNGESFNYYFIIISLISKGHISSSLADLSINRSIRYAASGLPAPLYASTGAVFVKTALTLVYAAGIL